MKITLESTTKTVMLNNVPARIWQGTTGAGVQVHAYIVRIAAPNDADQTEFLRELQEHAAPRPEITAIPMRLIL